MLAAVVKNRRLNQIFRSAVLARSAATQDIRLRISDSAYGIHGG